MKKLVAFLAILVVVGGLFADKFMDDYEEAERLLTQKNYEQAYRLYNGLIRESASRGFAAELKYRTAQCAYNLGRFEVAISLLEKVLNEDIPSDARYAYLEPQVRFSLGLCYFQIGEVQRAQRFLDEAEALGGMGIADYLIRMDYRTAYDHLKDKEYPVDKLFLARSLINSRDPEFFSDIRYLLTQLSEEVALEELVDFSRAEMQFFNQDYATSKNVFRDFMTKYPQTALRPYAEYYLACSYFHEKEYRYSIDLLSKLTDPNKSGYVLAAHAFFMRGEAYKELELPDSAMFSFEQARIVAPNSMVDFYTTYRLYEIHREEYEEKGEEIALASAKREAKRMGDIALRGREQLLMENLSRYVRGNIEFDQSAYTEALNYYREVTIDLPSPDYATEEELLVYESALSMALLALNRQDNRESYNTAMTVPHTYFTVFKRDSVALEYGGDWRAYLLYNQADATYYSSYVRGEIRNIKRREGAREMYAEILDKYPGAYMSTLAKVALAWYKLEAGEGYYDEAIAEFDALTNPESPTATLKKDALVLAAYGKALAYFYKGDYANAGNWFLNEEDYEIALSIAVNREDASERVRYNEIADSLIDRSLFWRGLCLEALGGYGDALDIYQHIADAYSDRGKAGDAWQKIIEFNLRGGRVEVAVSATEEVKSKMTVNPRIYKPAYGYGLALLYNHYYTSGDEVAAEEYAKKLQSELGTTEYIEQLYYDQAMRDTSIANIGDLRGKIEMIRARNPRSTYLPDPLFLLSLLLVEDESFDEAKDVLVELKNWSDISATGDRMPDISYQLGRVHFQTENYQDAATEFESWTRYYETGENPRTDLAPFVYYFLGLSYYNLGDQEASPQVRAGYYRKALKNFEVIKESYAESDFYAENADQVERFISQCRKGIG